MQILTKRGLLFYKSTKKSSFSYWCFSRHIFHFLLPILKYANTATIKHNTIAAILIPSNPTFNAHINSTTKRARNIVIFKILLSILSPYISYNFGSKPLIFIFVSTFSNSLFLNSPLLHIISKFMPKNEMPHFALLNPFLS